MSRGIGLRSTAHYAEAKRVAHCSSVLDLFMILCISRLAAGRSIPTLSLYTLFTRRTIHSASMSAAVASRAALTSITGQFAQINLSQAAATPEDYAKYAFELPHERYVGLLKCQLDPNARELETLVVRCEKQKEPAVARSNGKEKGKAKAGGKASTQPVEVYEVELLDTVLFPEGELGS